MQKYWNITSEKKMLYAELFDDVKKKLSILEAKLIWYLRNSEFGTVSKFLNLACKFYEVQEEKLAVKKLLVDSQCHKNDV